MIHKQFRLPRKPTNEYSIIKRLLERKTISFKAKQQLRALLLLDAKNNIADIAALVGNGTKTITMWRNLYSEKGLESLLVYTEKNEGKKCIKTGNVTLRNAPSVIVDKIEVKEEEESSEESNA